MSELPRRYTMHRRRLRETRNAIETRLTEAVTAQFDAGWRRLHPFVRGLTKATSPGEEAFWDEWTGEMSAVMDEVLLNGANDLAELESPFWADVKGVAVDLTGAAILALYHSRRNVQIGIEGAVSVTRRQAEQLVTQWHQDPESGTEVLVERLSRWFSPSRADVIGVTETTGLLSAMTDGTMGALGVDAWVWVTAFDTLVCPYCLQKHGRTFMRTAPMPPGHGKCRCEAQMLLDAAAWW